MDFSEANDTAVRAMVEKVRQGGSVSAFYDEIMTRVDYLCRRTMNETILEGIKSSGKKMFARVPNGRHTCAFCFMLASRGFVYWTRASAGEFNHYHSNCRCTIVPGDPDADPNEQVEGYKPSELYSRYESCVNAVDYDYDKFKKLQDSGKTKQTWEQWKQNKLIKEIRTRDAGWLWEGTEKDVIYKKPKEKLNDNEQKSVEVLKKSGFLVEVNEEDPNAPANIDFTINGQLWEHKNIGHGKHSAEDRLRDGCHKWKDQGITSKVRQVVTLEDNVLSLEENIKRIKARMPRYADEVLIIVSDDVILRLIA